MYTHIHTKYITGPINLYFGILQLDVIKCHSDNDLMVRRKNTHGYYFFLLYLSLNMPI